MLFDFIKTEKCFKLVCGAGNEDALEVEKLVILYSKAGCNIFDVSANPEIINAAKRGIKNSGITQNRYICCSVGIKGDPHTSKAYIDSDLCTKCGQCFKSCERSAIQENSTIYEINRQKCIGCSKCIKACPKDAIKLSYEFTDLRKVLPKIIEQGIDCIEFHAISDDDFDVEYKWQILNELYNGPLSICVDRQKLSNEKLLKRVKNMLKIRTPFTTIIQADGVPMSGGKDDFKTTLQSVATAELFQNEQLPVYLFLSGGTNSKSTELASLCGVHINGVAIGSFARKIVKDFINREDFLENEEIFNQALKIATNLVDKSLTNIN